MSLCSPHSRIIRQRSKCVFTSTPGKSSHVSHGPSQRKAPGGLRTPALRLAAGRTHTEKEGGWAPLRAVSRLLGMRSSPWASLPATWPGTVSAGGELSDHHAGRSWHFTEQLILQWPHGYEDTAKPVAALPRTVRPGAKPILPAAAEKTWLTPARTGCLPSFRHFLSGPQAHASVAPPAERA